MINENIHIVSFKQARDFYDKKCCKHRHIEIDPVLWQIKCDDCGQLIDPIGWMIDQAKEESVMRFELEELKKEYDKTVKKLENKNRCKCEYCGKMTHIVK
jgi:hypothetical protein